LALLGFFCWRVALPVFREWYWFRHTYSTYTQAATANLRAYMTAQHCYKMFDLNGDGKHKYAASLSDLYIDKQSGKEAKLTSLNFVAAHGPTGTPTCGYRFLECKTIGGNPIDWTQDFALCATPAGYAIDGRLTLITCSRGMNNVEVWGKDLGKSMFIADFPENPKAEGWRLMD
jgi:hypothetical protein